MSGRLIVEMDFLSRFGKRLDESWQIGPEAETGFPVRILISGSSSSVEQEIATLVCLLNTRSFRCLIIEAVFVMLHYHHMVWHGFHALRNCFVLSCRSATEIHDTDSGFSCHLIR